MNMKINSFKLGFDLQHESQTVVFAPLSPAHGKPGVLGAQKPHPKPLGFWTVFDTIEP